MFLENDRDEDHEPIAHERKEILEDCEEMVAACNSTDEVNGNNDADPKVTGNSLAVTTKHLTTESRRICSWNVV